LLNVALFGIIAITQMRSLIGAHSIKQLTGSTGTQKRIKP